MRAYLTQYTRIPFIVVASILLLFFLVDFMQRVWRPLSPQEANISQPVEAAKLVETPFEQPSYLAQWLQNSEQGKSDDNANSDSELATEIVSLPGSTLLNNDNVRVRGIFISGNTGYTGNAGKDNTQGQAVAVVEIQNTKDGALNKVQWRPGDSISGWEVSTIEANKVLLSRANEAEDIPQIALYVFDRIRNRPPNDEPTNSELSNNKNQAQKEETDVNNK
jgi:hypothetical protein